MQVYIYIYMYIYISCVCVCCNHTATPYLRQQIFWLEIEQHLSPKELAEQRGQKSRCREGPHGSVFCQQAKVHTRGGL